MRKSLIVDDLIPDNIPDSAWTNDVKQAGCAYVTMKFRCNKRTISAVLVDRDKPHDGRRMSQLDK